MSRMDKEKRLTIEGIADYILKNYSEFLDDNGLLDAEYIREKFDLKPSQLPKVL